MTATTATVNNAPQGDTAMTTASHTVGVLFDTDCDGTSIAFFNLDHPRIREVYPDRSYDDTVTLAEFEAKVLPTLSAFSRSYWKSDGYYSDASGIRNCEIARPCQPKTVALLWSGS